ncbi:39S ribosomal protein L52, mitochondrial isoform X2 [Wyeomyia smithii]|uniref:39S ribosomal protein L52, mitochondrial isoform X2 n=1 Tax=Wyeomyia smithii TaxID=174621 RepID=UPI002467C926|nr:39S ribosomal protein L52, mitochondrial isoform X2 [Wyeomyia smithii]
MTGYVLYLPKSSHLRVYIVRRLNVAATLSANFHAHSTDRRFPENHNKSSPLTNLPDYTFLDGRATPLGANQKKRMLKQCDLANRIVTLSKEMDFAVDRYNRIQEEKLDNTLLDTKFKHKGHLLLSTETEC